MKVIFCNRKDWLVSPGGDVIQMLKTKEFLEKLYNINIAILTKPENIKDIDASIVHIFNIQRIDESLAFAYEAKQNGKKIVLSPIFWDLSHANFVNILSRFGIFNIRKYFAYIKSAYEIFLKPISKFSKKPYYYSTEYKNKGKELLFLSDMVLPNSIEELKVLEKFFEVSIKNFEVVFNAVDTEIFKNQKGIKNCEREKKVICSARIEPTKNQLSLIRSLYEFKDIKIQLVGKVGNKSYYEKVLKTAQNRGNVDIINNFISQVELAKLFYDADVHALPSFRESPGLSTLESLYCGLNVVVSCRAFCPIDTYFKDLIDKKVFICNPYDVNSIQKAILRALETKEKEICNQNNTFSWEIAAQQTYHAYTQLLKYKEEPVENKEQKG